MNQWRCGRRKELDNQSDIIKNLCKEDSQVLLSWRGLLSCGLIGGPEHVGADFPLPEEVPNESWVVFISYFNGVFGGPGRCSRRKPEGGACDWTP